MLYYKTTFFLKWKIQDWLLTTDNISIKINCGFWQANFSFPKSDVSSFSQILYITK